MKLHTAMNAPADSPDTDDWLRSTLKEGSLGAANADASTKTLSASDTMTSFFIVRVVHCMTQLAYFGISCTVLL